MVDICSYRHSDRYLCSPIRQELFDRQDIFAVERARLLHVLSHPASSSAQLTIPVINNAESQAHRRKLTGVSHVLHHFERTGYKEHAVEATLKLP